MRKMMSGEQKRKITRMRMDGQGYGAVADALGIPVGTVKSFCRRNGLLGEGGADITEPPAIVKETAAHAPEEKPEEPQENIQPQERPEDLKDDGKCPYCGEELIQIPGKRQKRFCSDGCRLGWWNEHKELIRSAKAREVRCASCGKVFKDMDGRGRKYCSHECYIRHRFGGDHGKDGRDATGGNVADDYGAVSEREAV